MGWGAGWYRAGRQASLRTSSSPRPPSSYVEGIRALSADYDHLYRVTGNTLPFAGQEWHLAWCEHLLSHTDRASQQPPFCVLRIGDGTCAPLRIETDGPEAIGIRER